MILAGDIGGTNSRLSLYLADGRTLIRQRTLASRSFPSLEAVIAEFVAQMHETVTAACFGVAGPVIAQRCTATNLPWVIDAAAISGALGIEKVSLINDLVALALGALTLDSSKLRPLRGEALPKRSGENLAVLAAGTGLGEAALVWDGERLVPLATEGGHVDFAPRNALECELLAFLSAKHGHVSYERIVSGPGIYNLYEFFRDAKHMSEQPEVAARLAATKDANAEISRLARSGESPAARAAMNVFLSLYGAAAGNLALKTLATGGVYVAGGIANQLADELQAGEFIRSFEAKGRMGALLRDVPIALVLDCDIGMAGSASYAARLSK